MKGKAMGMGAAALVVSGGVLASRVLGLGRETMLAALIGVNAVGDVYRAAFLVPDLLNYLLAGGYLTITFVPILAARLAVDDPEGGNRAFVAVFRVVTGLTLLLTAVLMVWTGPLIELIYPELSPDQLGEVTRLTLIALPAQVFFVGGSLLMAYQYAHRRFLVPVAAPIVYNMSIILGWMTGGILADPVPADGFVWGALVGAAVGNFGLQWFGARRVGLRLVRGVEWKHGAVGTNLALAVPLIVGQSVAVLDEQFVRFFGQ
ncbi:MAG: murein biosynthesis integral membrane protein MurJ, partial [Acidimicrobiia bacterium]|nr:murein biosynthesis integral membrane protein MurJ [Acidimicrobiia bacterium]